MTEKIPAPKFRLFERVVISADEGRNKDFHGKEGTIICLESYYVRRNTADFDQWLYVVHLPSLSVCRSFAQSDLGSLGCFDTESAHLGQRAEISFDLLLEDDHNFMEGSYRLPGEFWKVFIFNKDEVPALRFRPERWERGSEWERDIDGIVIRFPRSSRMGREALLHAMSRAFGVTDWVQVQGPDSMMLR